MAVRGTSEGCAGRVAMSLALLAVALGAAACGTRSRGLTETHERFALSSRDTVVRFIRLGQSGNFAAACATLDLTHFEGNDLYGHLRDTALASLTADGPTQAARKRELDGKRARLTSCRGVLSVIFEELGPRAGGLARRAARIQVFWLGPVHTDVFLGRDEAWTLTSTGRTWRISTTDALADALP
jgi:hypothetical protein